MGRLVSFLRWASPKGLKKNWTLDERRRVKLAMTYAASSWIMVGCVAYMHFTTEKKQSSPKEDPEFLKDVADVDDDQLLVDKHEVFSATYTSPQAPVPLSTRISQFFNLSFKKLEKTSPEK